MGKVKEAVKRHIRNGDVIACDVEADFAVITGECQSGLATQEEGPGGLEPVQPEAPLLCEWSLQGSGARRGPGLSLWPLIQSCNKCWSWS